MPSGASPAIGRPSHSTVPSVAGVSPAIISRSVDLPQPDGPTTAKNSPRESSRLIGPSACRGCSGVPVRDGFLAWRTFTFSVVTPNRSDRRSRGSGNQASFVTKPLDPRLRGDDTAVSLHATEKRVTLAYRQRPRLAVARSP